AKLDLVCRKLGLEPGMRLLDIGCGWGALLEYAADRYKVEVVGVTVSREQAALARERCKGLPVEVRLQDYRDVRGETFDRVASIGMFEHVGHKNHHTFMEVAHRSLAEGGLLLLHTIGRHRSSTALDPWIGKHIFPNSLIPSSEQIASAADGLFVIEDWHNFGPDYDTTLLAWHRNFERAWLRLVAHYGEGFRRMWRYYLLTSAGGFRARHNQLWQIVLSPRGVVGGYESAR
ncbi:MAG: class I SAM-dependent methyltransferase, partial [Myxococcota bacterium]